MCNAVSPRVIQMKYKFVPIWGSREKPVAWVGPYDNIVPEARGFLTPVDKQAILERQGGTCNCCEQRIKLRPYADCDADHIVGVCRGGKTVPENMQLLSVTHHRAKSANESRGAFRIVQTDVILDSRELYIFTHADFQFPVDKRTPLDALTYGCALSILSYAKVHRAYSSPGEFDYVDMLNRFAFKPDDVQ